MDAHSIYRRRRTPRTTSTFAPAWAAARGVPTRNRPGARQVARIEGRATRSSAGATARGACTATRASSASSSVSTSPKPIATTRRCATTIAPVEASASKVSADASPAFSGPTAPSTSTTPARPDSRRTPPGAVTVPLPRCTCTICPRGSTNTSTLASSTARRRFSFSSASRRRITERRIPTTRISSSCTSRLGSSRGRG